MNISDLFESIPQNIVVIYPGRFQPWHKGHKAVYDHLCSEYGAEHTFISTSNNTEPLRSPFNFQEKRQMMLLTGVDPSKIVQSSQPYKSSEIISHYEPTTTVAIFAISEKDMVDDPRFKFGPKKDGSPSYFQAMPSNISECKSLDQHAYMITVPTFQFTVLGKPMQSATEIRSQYASSNDTTKKEIIKDLFGNYSDDIYKLMNNKLSFELNESADGIAADMSLVQTGLDAMQKNFDSYVKLLAQAEKMAVQHTAAHPEHSSAIQKLYQQFVNKLQKASGTLDVASGFNQFTQKIKTESVGGTSTSGISTVIGGKSGKPADQVGSLFGGTYTQQTTKKRKQK